MMPMHINHTEKKLYELQMQANERKRKSQKIYQASRLMRLNEDRYFELQQAVVVRNNQIYS